MSFINPFHNLKSTTYDLLTIKRSIPYYPTKLRTDFTTEIDLYNSLIDARDARVSQIELLRARLNTVMLTAPSVDEALVDTRTILENTAVGIESATSQAERSQWSVMIPGYTQVLDTDNNPTGVLYQLVGGDSFSILLDERRRDITSDIQPSMIRFKNLRTDVVNLRIDPRLGLSVNPLDILDSDRLRRTDVLNFKIDSLQNQSVNLQTDASPIYINPTGFDTELELFIDTSYDTLTSDAISIKLGFPDGSDSTILTASYTGHVDLKFEIYNSEIITKTISLSVTRSLGAFFNTNILGLR